MSLAMQTQIKTRVFAEFRPNINIVAITISLATPATRSTLSRLSKDRSQFCVQHSDEEFTISIPAEVSSQADQRSYGSFQPEERVVARELPRFTQATVHQTFVPWSAPALGNEIELICQSCNSTILPRETVKIWKDLPSEGWAEMMDLWHCHKPNEHDHGDGNATASKGYSASSKLTAKSETGFVDVMSFLFTKGDCTGVQVGRFLSISYSDSHYLGKQEKSLRGWPRSTFNGRALIQLPDIESVSAKHANLGSVIVLLALWLPVYASLFVLSSRLSHFSVMTGLSQVDISYCNSKAHCFLPSPKVMC